MSATETLTVVGSRARRLDAADKVTGYARYASDLRLPGMLYGKIVRSERPHARDRRDRHQRGRGAARGRSRC